MSDMPVQQQPENTLPPHSQDSAPGEPESADQSAGPVSDAGTSDSPTAAPAATNNAVTETTVNEKMVVAEAAPEKTVTEKTAREFPTSGAELTGRVTLINDENVFVDVGLPRRAIVPVESYRNGSLPEIGSTITVLMVRVDAKAGLIRAYGKGTVAEPDIGNLVRGAIVEGKVTGLIKGGLEARFGDLRGFIPASQVDTKTMKDISVLLGENVRCEVLEVDKKSGQIVVSRRTCQAKDRIAACEKLFAELKVGQVRKGVVSGLADFGVFVDLGGLRGLVHVTDLKWVAVDKPSDVVNIGDEVEVKVLKINKKRQRVSLGMKQATPDPWADVDKKFAVGAALKVRVVKLAEFGAFAEIAEGVNGLIPLSEMTWSQRPAHARDMLEIGQLVDVGVIKVEGKRRRIALSLKQVTDDPWLKVDEQFSVSDVVQGKVSKLLDFGVLVELSPGIEGMVHISELSENRVKTPGDVTSTGDDVSVRVLAVDRKKRRIGLSLKAANAKAVVPDKTAAPQAEKLIRKKPLRGGLSSHFNW